MDNTKFPVLFYAAILFTVAALALCIYALIPNINHVFVPTWAEPTKVHEKYVALFGGIAALGVITIILTRPRSGAK